MKSGKHDLEAITVRRTKMAGSDKVRYRVYSSPTEYVAVIAESALMAVRLADVKVPHKIMRDLPTEGVAIEAKKMAELETIEDRVSFRIAPEEKKEALQTEMRDRGAAANDKPFVPVGFADLSAKTGQRASILSPDLLHEIIEQHARTYPEAETQPAPEHETVLVPEPEDGAVDAAPDAVEPIPAAEPMAAPLRAPAPRAPTAASKLTEMANAMLPKEEVKLPKPRSEEGVVLSQEEVGKLLNE